MPDVTFVYPCLGRFPNTKYVRTWQMQPLAIAVLSGLTPSNWSRHLFDDRLEEIDFDRPTDFVAISVETYNARRAYQIAAEYRKRNVPVIMGGFHPTFCPDEVGEHADAVCIGEAESVWADVLLDAADGNLKKIYKRQSPDVVKTVVDRSIFEDKNYLDIHLVEYGRGCKFKCNFCSITAFHNATYRRRDVSEIIAELKELQGKNVFFVDDNIVANIAELKELLKAMIPLDIKWVSQGSVNMAWDDELLKLMVDSGCLGVLIGFESLDDKNMDFMNKGVNQIKKFPEAVKRLRHVGMRIYGTFIFGYPNDSDELIEETLRFANEQKLFMAAFNHLVPFPGTDLYNQIEKAGQLKHEKWWLNEDYRFGQLVYDPESKFSSKDIEEGCMDLRRRFYSLSSIFARGWDFKANSRTLQSAKTFYGLNLLLRREVKQKFGLPLGVHAENER
jgi:radical SAM superfamily enzyme YgiQ (UPF0313 family)